MTKEASGGTHKSNQLWSEALSQRTEHVSGFSVVSAVSAACCSVPVRGDLDAIGWIRLNSRDSRTNSVQAGMAEEERHYTFNAVIRLLRTMHMPAGTTTPWWKY